MVAALEIERGERRDINYRSVGIRREPLLFPNENKSHVDSPLYRFVDGHYAVVATRTPGSYCYGYYDYYERGGASYTAVLESATFRRKDDICHVSFYHYRQYYYNRGECFNIHNNTYFNVQSEKASVLQNSDAKVLTFGANYY